MMPVRHVSRVTVKRFIAGTVLGMGMLSAAAQVNIQMHYDFGRMMNPHSEKDRQQVTATLEQYRPDRLGSTFYFVDFDFYSKGMKGAYVEFAREFNIRKGLAAHIEYNGGLTSGHSSEYGSQFQHCILAGPAYNMASKDFRRTLSLQAMYKQYFEGQDNKAYPSFQVTGVWGLTFGRDDMFTFCGFVDIWRDRRASDGHISLTVCSEPQFWFNLDSLKGVSRTGLSLGTEVEVSNNFIVPAEGHRTFFCNPTLAVKWTMGNPF